jgi:hypothetical protein
VWSSKRRTFPIHFVLILEFSTLSENIKLSKKKNVNSELEYFNLKTKNKSNQTKLSIILFMKLLKITINCFHFFDPAETWALTA